MKQDFDFNSKKFFILLAIICLLFLVLVLKALTYLPKQESVPGNNIQQEATVNSQTMKEENAADKAAESTTEESVKNEDNEKDSKIANALQPDDGLEFIELDTPDTVTEVADKETEAKKELTAEEKAEQFLKNAKNYRVQKQYLKALDEYQKVTSETSDKELVASSYEGISSLYAINKRYGTALTYAIKAYNLAPNSYRELMLARLYYKTGNIHKATQRINNILRRDFADDRW